MRRLSTDRPLFLREVRFAHDARLCLLLTVTLVLRSVLENEYLELLATK
jgi:hypothetical protein